ncbi:MAG: hypothetical protein DCC48_03490 [Acidobacteria bacterium]|nr:MAG: hypothetical protein DCC48_03490 [Acidobacteriota bacterium]
MAVVTPVVTVLGEMPRVVEAGPPPLEPQAQDSSATTPTSPLTTPRSPVMLRQYWGTEAIVAWGTEAIVAG